MLALDELDALTRRLRRECPWDREQDERSIIPLTVGEVHELAEAVTSGDDEEIVDELGDVLYHVFLLALLLEERGKGSLEDVARNVQRKLIRRHPHVFGEEVSGVPLPGPVATADDVARNWKQIKQIEAQRKREGKLEERQ